MTAETGRLYCFVCHQLVVGQYYTFGIHHYHATCFSCEKCKESLAQVGLNVFRLQPILLNCLIFQGFYKRGSHLFCEKCFTDAVAHKLTKCPFCKQVVGVGKFIKAVDQLWHVDCFICRDCKKHIDKEYYNVEHKIYCKDCFTTRPPSDKEEAPPAGTSTIQDAPGKKADEATPTGGGTIRDPPRKKSPPTSSSSRSSSSYSGTA